MTLLPAGLSDPRDLTLEAQQPETNTAHLETAQEAVNTPTYSAAVVGPCRKLGLVRTLVSQS